MPMPRTRAAHSMGKLSSEETPHLLDRLGGRGGIIFEPMSEIFPAIGEGEGTKGVIGAGIDDEF